MFLLQGVATKTISRVFGISVFLLIITVCFSIPFPELGTVSGIIALLCLILGLISAPKSQAIIVAIVLSLIGLSLVVLSYLLSGALPQWSDLLRLNQELTAMVASVSFLRLITPKHSAEQSRVTGKIALFRTGLFTHLVGSVVNIIAVGLVADQVKRQKPLTVADASLLSLSYTAGAFWSPFWAAAAAAAAFMPGANPLIHISLGAVTAVITLIVVFVHNLMLRTKDELAQYHGYELSWALLRIPLALVAFVLILHELLPGTSIPKLVVLGAVTVTIIGLLGRYKLRTPLEISKHAISTLPNSRTEISLFIAAGVFTIGITLLQHSTNFELNLPSFNAWIAWLMILLGILLSVGGIHPIVSMTIFAGLLIQSQPNPTVFVLAATITWGLASAIGPVSGIANYLNGQYQIPNLKLIKTNAVPVAVSAAIALPMLLLAEQLSQ